MPLLQVIPAGDLRLDKGDVVWLEDADYVRQKLAVRFKFFLGEWFADKRQGVPYYRDVLRKNPSLDVIRSVYRRVILGTPGIVGLRRFDMLFDRRGRALRYDFEAVLASGGVLTITSTDEPFIVAP